MIEGIEILNKTEIMTVPGWYNTSLIITIVICGICIVMFIASLEWDGPVGCIIFGIGLLVSIFALACLLVCPSAIKQPTGRYKYECVISDDVSFSEVLEHYDVVEQKGKIWVLVDKEE